MSKYFINEKEKCIVNGHSGEIVRPSCIDDVIIYHSYLVGHSEKKAQALLEDIFRGEKVMTKMVQAMSEISNTKK